MTSNRIEDLPAGDSPSLRSIGELLPVATRGIVAFLVTAVMAVLGMFFIDQGNGNIGLGYLHAVSGAAMAISVTVVVALFVAVVLMLRVLGESRATSGSSRLEPDQRAETGIRFSKAMASLSAKALLACVAGIGVCFVLMTISSSWFSASWTSSIRSGAYSISVFLGGGLVAAATGLFVFLWALRALRQVPGPTKPEQVPGPTKP